MVSIVLGKDNADTMLTLKKGYSNVHAKMNGANRNIIGDQSLFFQDLEGLIFMNNFRHIYYSSPVILIFLYFYKKYLVRHKKLHYLGHTKFERLKVTLSW